MAVKHSKTLPWVPEPQTKQVVLFFRLQYPGNPGYDQWVRYDNPCPGHGGGGIPKEGDEGWPGKNST